MLVGFLREKPASCRKINWNTSSEGGRTRQDDLAFSHREILRSLAMGDLFAGVLFATNSRMFCTDSLQNAFIVPAIGAAKRIRT